jgi:streptomycin 6-kinase
MSGNFLDNLPKRFTQNALGVCGRKGEDWLKDLPRIIEELSASWSLEVEKSFLNLSYNYVAPCVCEGKIEAVLKIGLPEETPEIFSEADFLQIANGAGTVKILMFDKKRHALLLEKLSPGKHLKEIFCGNETESVKIAVDVMKKLCGKPIANFEFRRLEEWFKGLDRAENTTFPQGCVRKAQRFFYELNSRQKYLIHGDLHHENILSASREPFLAIDPKGIVGDIGYEISVFLNNHLWWLASDPNLREKLSDAVRQFSEAFAIKPQDLRKWAYAQMVLSAWWTFEENGKNWQTDLALVEIWEANID